jgi:Cft2 family RNA processing exonuclease
MQIVYKNGIHLPQSQLWLDPHAVQQSAVVSHAHADHMCGHQEVLCTPATSAMMQLRGATKCRFQSLSFGEAVEIGGAAVTLLPAGHVLGSAQVLVESQGERLLYSGDFKLRSGLSAEAAAVPQADVLIMETTFGLPRYQFPARETVMQEITAFCRESLSEGCTPVLFCYSLGKGQEVLAGLDGVEFPIYLHSAHWKMANLYREFGVQLPPYRRYWPGMKIDGGVLLCAAGCRRGTWFQELSCIRTAYISGWALDRGAKWRFGTDAAFPLSDHADYDELLQYVYLTGAQRIYTMHGFAGEFAADLREVGFDARPLQGAESAVVSKPLRHVTTHRRVSAGYGRKQSSNSCQMPLFEV